MVVSKGLPPLERVNADARFGLMFDLSRVAVLPAVQSWHVV
jgi:hypothetical protein